VDSADYGIFDCRLERPYAGTVQSLKTNTKLAGGRLRLLEIAIPQALLPVDVEPALLFVPIILGNVNRKLTVHRTTKEI
jgi:hypothetical protein